MLKFLKSLVEAVMEARRRRIELMMRSGVYHGWY